MAAACLTLTACQDTATSTPAATKTVTQAPAADGADDKADAPAEETVAVPDFVGMGLQEAQDAAQVEGFFLLTSHDNTGAGRMQVFDRNWKVCDQNYAAGKTIPASTELDFGTVKLSETCP
ncbi:PASTA domain-containing protein [Streptomyces sp. NBC_01794]|uniref:PASTA domain-containing protein n=1 Tax=Streptomyces sp. NBC_01794 TaxID=2975942 RepID=UPI00308BAD4B|nr:PASTA domain-containing protein [Streptomyces sp. NBC_01794]